ncbi:MAG: hypothetical protein R6X19_08890 [Kiritimatiellia bacterium]
MKIPGRVGIGGFLVSISAYVFLMGCEVTSRSNELEIEPASATLQNGQTVRLEASGGDDYIWRLSDNTLGSLSSDRGDTVVYTSLVSPASPLVQTVTVVADEEAGGATNEAIEQKMANAFITHVTRSVSTSQVSVIPASAGLKQGQSLAFTASGDSSYTWSLETPGWGVLSRLNGRSVVYVNQYTDPGSKIVVQQIRVVGASGGSAQVDVAHIPGDTLFIEPQTVNLRYGEHVHFAVQGGSGESTWSLSQPSWGTLDRLTGPYTTYTSFHSNTVVEVQTITVTDISSASVKGYIYHIP